MKEGSKVNVCMSNDSCFSLAVQKYDTVIRNCTLKYTPSNTGDCFHIVTEDGIELIVNPSSKDFIGIEEIKDTAQEDDNLPF